MGLALFSFAKSFVVVSRPLPCDIKVSSHDLQAESLPLFIRVFDVFVFVFVFVYVDVVVVVVVVGKLLKVVETCCC